MFYKKSLDIKHHKNLEAREIHEGIQLHSNNSGISRITRHSFLINLALIIISVVFALFLSEAALRLLGWSPMYVSPERDHFWRYDSLLGWAQQPGQQGVFETPQFHTTVHINHQGLRGPEYSYEKSGDTSRILVVGDSFAWGYGVEETQRFSELLEKSLGVEVINAGVSGYSTDQELLWFRDEGIKYMPDLVILVFTGNDIGDNERQIVSTIYYKPMFVMNGGKLELSNYPVPKTGLRGRVIYYLSQRSSLFYFLVQRYFDLLDAYRGFKVNISNPISTSSDTSPQKMPFELTIALLHEIQHIAESRNARFMIVATDSWWNSSSSWTYKDFIDTLHSEQFSILDVESMPGFDPGKMLIPEDGHWNRAGHEFVAERIYEFIESNQLLSQTQN